MNIKAYLRFFLFLFFILSFLRYELADAYEDSTTVTSSPYLAIPDGPGDDECGDEVAAYIYTIAPDEAIVLSVDIFFAVLHNYPMDLVVILQYDDDTMHYEVLWNYGSVHGSTYSKTNDWSFFGLKANAEWKLKIKDCDQGVTGTLNTWTLKVRYHVPPDPPAFVWANTGSGQREIDVSWTPVLDTQCVSYRIEWNRNQRLLNDYNIIEGDASVPDCDYTSKTINWLNCVEYYYFRIRTVSMYGAIGRPSWPLAGASSSYCQDVFVYGTLKYINYDDKDAGYSSYPEVIPLSRVLVTFWDSSGDSLEVPTVFTGRYFGDFYTTLPIVNNPIYLKFYLVNEDTTFTIFDWDSKFLIYTFSDTLGPDSSFYVVLDESLSTDTQKSFGKACYSFDYLQSTRNYFQLRTSWDTPPVQVYYDYDNVDSVAKSGLDSVNQTCWIYITNMKIPPQIYMYRMDAPIHEYAHIIHMRAWDVNSIYKPECPQVHYPDSPTSGYCALVEGWAEFLSCIIQGDKAKYLRHNNQDLEYNNWWSGSDGTNENGSFVEGAVASAWYDMEDLNIDYPDERSGTEYYELGYEFAKIFDIFGALKPQDMVEFMDYWQSYPGLEDWEREHLVKIFAQHYIFKPGDANSDGKVSVSDIVFLISYLFKQGPAPEPSWVGDANGDCHVSVSDTVYLIAYLFKQGAEPVYNPDC